MFLSGYKNLAMFNKSWKPCGIGVPVKTTLLLAVRANGKMLLAYTPSGFLTLWASSKISMVL